MKITQKDLIGEIKDFPIEVVQKMVERQVEQWDEADVTVFQDFLLGGFTWTETIEGGDFWWVVIGCKKFDIFFAKYPKDEEDCCVDPKGRGVLAWDGSEYSVAFIPQKTKLSLSTIAEKFGLKPDEIEIDFDK